MATPWLPEGYHSVTPYLVVEDILKQMDFFIYGLNGVEKYRMPGPSGSIVHAEVRVGNSMIMLGAAMEGFAPTAGTYYHYVPDVDATYNQAISKGGESVEEPKDQFWGDRTAKVKDPSGNTWYLATAKERLSPEELNQRAESALAQA